MSARDYGEMMAGAAGDGFDSPEEAAASRRRARQDAAEELADEWADNFPRPAASGLSCSVGRATSGGEAPHQFPAIPAGQET